MKKKWCQEPGRPRGPAGHRAWLSVGPASLPLARPQQPRGSQCFGEACAGSWLRRVSAPSAEAAPLLAQSLAALPSVPPRAGQTSCWHAGCCARSRSCHSRPPGTRGTRVVVRTSTESVAVSPAENERVRASVQAALGSCSAAWAIDSPQGPLLGSVRRPSAPGREHRPFAGPRAGRQQDAVVGPAAPLLCSFSCRSPQGR